MKAFLCVCLLLISGLVEARVYQWINPTTGNSQLSGKPPAWYRSESSGPRVLVFENNKLVDDTAILVDEAHRINLRNTAFNIASDAEKVAISREKAVARLEQQIQSLVESPEMAVYLKTPVTESEKPEWRDHSEKVSEIRTGKPETAGEKSDESSDERVERLKALISTWEKNQTESARTLLESENNTSVSEKPLSDPQQ